MLSENLSFHRAVAMKWTSPWIIGNHGNHDFSKIERGAIRILSGPPWACHGVMWIMHISWVSHAYSYVFQVHQINENMEISQNLAPNIPTTWHEIIGLIGDSQFSYAYSYDFDRKSQFAKLWYPNPAPQININMEIYQNLAPNTPTTWHEVIGLMVDSQFSCVYSFDFQ